MTRRYDPFKLVPIEVKSGPTYMKQRQNFSKIKCIEAAEAILAIHRVYSFIKAQI